MANKMLIDASHPEETRVVVLRGNRVEEFDFESASKKQLRGNIYLAKVTRVEPSLQAAFVDYGGNRHGFLAFSEIHPDYYQIPVADRQALLEEEAHARHEDEEEERGPVRRSRRHRRDQAAHVEARTASKDESVSEPAPPEAVAEDQRPIQESVETTGKAQGTAEAREAVASAPEMQTVTEAGEGPAEAREAAADAPEMQTPAEAEEGPAEAREAAAGAPEMQTVTEAGEGPAEARETAADTPEMQTVTEAGEGTAEAVSAASPAEEAAAKASEETGEGVREEETAREPGATEFPAHGQNETVLVDPQGYAVIEEHEVAALEPKRSAAPTGDEGAQTSKSAPEPSENEPEAREGDASRETEENAEWSAEAAAAEPQAVRKSNEDEDDEEAEEEQEEEHVEQFGGDAMEEVPARVHRSRRQYKIQEVIKRRQVLLVQVVKEERGNKGAALTTYLSLAGRYSVLMPNTARGGGISRKITDSADRKRLKAIAQELDVPEGMGVILRTAGALRTKAEVKRDFEYLLRMWESVRELTLKSTAATLVYEEGSLIKRAIRDLYSKDIDEVLVAGEEAYKEAKDFMRMLMPSHAKNVKLYRDAQPIFAKAGVEAQLDALFSNQVTLRSGGYLVINQAEALVAIDVNSGRSTREHNIEDTALRTNLEAADEIARQLRLRDLAGLIVVDFIDMEENRNNRAVERRLKEALRNDRARIQVGRISHFGLLEMSRQRIRTGVFEGSTVVCPHCAGAGMVRSTASIALHVLRVLEEALIKSASHNLIVRTRTEVALYILNQKRSHLHELEERFGVQITVAADDSLQGTVYHALERGEPAIPPPDFARKALVRVDSIPPEEPDSDAKEQAQAEPLEEKTPSRRQRKPVAAQESEAEESEGGDGEASRRRRRRRRRRGRSADRESGPTVEPNAPQPSDAGLAAIAAIGGDITAGNEPVVAGFSDGETDEFEAESFELTPETEPGSAMLESSEIRPQRRSHRGGRNRRREGPQAGSAAPESTPSGDWLPESAEPSAPADKEPSAPADEAGAGSASATALAPTSPAAGAEATPITRAPSPTAEEEPSPNGEPAPASGPASTGPSASPQEVPTPAEPSASASPKRTGWWQRAKASLSH